MDNELRLGLVVENHFPRLGGMERENHALADAFTRIEACRVAVHCSSMPEVPDNFQYGYPVYRGRSLSYLTPLFARIASKKMVQRERINFLHGAMLHGGGFQAIQLGKLLGLPVAVRAHGADLQAVPEIGYGALLGPKLKQRVHFSLSEADIVTVPSQRLSKIAKECGADPARVHVVPSGVALKAMDRVPYVDMRSRYGISPNAFMIITVGRNRPIKRLSLLFEAVKLLLDRDPSIRCLCVGPKEDVAELAAMYGVERAVVATGPILPNNEDQFSTSAPPMELVNIYRGADLYVSTSYVESFGLAGLEALACGTPVVVTAGQGIEDILNANLAGAVVSNQTAAALANEFARFQSEPRSETREAARALAADYTWDRTAEHLCSLYLELGKAEANMLDR